MAEESFNVLKKLNTQGVFLMVLNKQRGGALANAVSSILIICTIIMLGAYIASPYFTINENKVSQLNAMVEGTKNTAFSQTFKDSIQFAMQDGVVKNHEFVDLKDLYNGFLLAKSTSTLDKYTKQASEELVSQQNSIVVKNNVMIFGFGIVGFFICLFLTTAGYRSMHP